MQPSSKFDYADVLREIKQADLSDADRLARAFDRVTNRVITLYEQEVEVARAVQDTDLLIKNQIKLEVMKSARQIFDNCYRFMLGGSAWDAEH